jgi:hypothetical protein
MSQVLLNFMLLVVFDLLVYVARLEFGWPLDIPEWSCQGAETTSPRWGNVSD